MYGNFLQGQQCGNLLKQISLLPDHVYDFPKPRICAFLKVYIEYMYSQGMYIGFPPELV
jgi:hypothetical protein